MKRLSIIYIGAVIVLIAVVTLPFWGMGPAVFLDSKRTIIARAPSPDGKRIAQIERIIVGGVPSIVVMVRASWMPDWYLTGCAAASHYQDGVARISWTSNNALLIRHTDDLRSWKRGSAPFHNEHCEDPVVSFRQTFA